MWRRPRITDDTIYAAVAARRAGFDNMAWQVPIISLTAQAFLLTIALSSDSTQFARTVAAALSAIVSLLSVVLLARHRQADIADAIWLAAREAERGDDRYRVHHQPWRDARNAAPIARGFGMLKRAPTFIIWQIGLLLFGLVAVLLIPVIWLAPDWIGGAAGATLTSAD